jgi:cell division protease FtsH
MKLQLFATFAGLLVIFAVVWSLGSSLGTVPAHTTSTASLSGPPKSAEPAEPFETSYTDLVRSAEEGTVESVLIDASDNQALVTFENHTQAETVLPADNGALLQDLADKGVNVKLTGSASEGDGGSGNSVLGLLLPPLVFIAVIWLVLALVRRRAAKAGGSGGGGGGMFGAPNTSLRASAQLTTVPSERFGDVAGCDEAVEELAELVDFLRAPERFELMGAKPPSGVILHGDPGTGKTLLAKALAGEAGVAFFATSGSDFVEKFVGVGASRVRELFERARSQEGGAVIFIDEIDAVGRSRTAGEGNGEREQTLNQILVELDGFTARDRVICIAATNRLDVLDPALLRPGRFGRHINVPLPAAAGRAAILRLHLTGKPLADGLDVDELATSMGGLSGAQLADAVNEAAIMAVREGATSLRRDHLREGYLRVLAGPKRRNAPIAEGELEVIAAHEAGHVLCAEYGERYEKAQQVTVEPRGRAMGLAVYGQTDRALHDADYLHEALVATLGGRAAEQAVFGRVSSGAANDLQKATELARRAVEEFGFSPRLGQIVAGNAPFAETTRSVIDAEIERMVADAYTDAVALLREHRDQLDSLRTQLVASRELERVDILAAIGNVKRLPRRAFRPRALPRLVPPLAEEAA